MWREKLESEARAKIFWGDSAEIVIAHLESQGIQKPEAETLTESFLAERAASVSALGRRSIFIGVGLVLLPLITFVIFTIAGVFLMKVFGLIVLVGLFGGWKIINGSIMVMRPRKYEGDLSQESDTP